MMGERGLRLCAACSMPSPGPTKRLYYQHRDYGPFFPILEEQRRKSNDCLFSGGRVLVCTGCASHLLRQWAYYEKDWTPLEKRTYTLLSEERLARKALKESLLAKVSMGANQDSSDQENHLSQTKPEGLQVYNHETMSDKVNSSRLNERISPLSFLSEGNNPFGRAVKKVSKQNTRTLAEYNEASKHSDLSRLPTLDKSEQWNEEEMDLRKSRLQGLWGLSDEDIRSKIREELEENIDVMIRKVAEIQYYDNLRKYEKELKDAAERMCRVQDSKGDIDRMCQSLKSQLQEELLFRDTLKVLNENKKEMNGNEKPLMSLEPPASILPAENLSKNHSSKSRMTGITNAKKAGKEWKGKSVRKKLRERAAASQPTENNLALVPCPTEDEPSATSRSDAEGSTSALRKLDKVVRELEKERQWRKRTESIVEQQRDMIEELRNGIQREVQRLIEQQNKRYHEIKENAGKSQRRQQTPGPRASTNGLSRPGQYKTPFITLDLASSADHDATQEDEERTRSRERGRPRKGRSRDQWAYKEDVPSPARNKKYEDAEKNRDHDDDDDNGDVTADSEDEGSSPATPEFYIQ